MKNSAIWSGAVILNQFAADSPKGLKKHAARSLSRLLRIISAEKDDLEASKTALVKQYAKVDDKGELVADEKGMIQFENAEGFNKEFNSLLEEETSIDISTLPKIKFVDLPDEGTSIAVIYALEELGVLEED